MNKHLSANQATYAPQTFKSFDGALYCFFVNECPQIGGDRTRQVLVSSIHEMVRKFFPATNHLSAGQTVWTTVHKDAKGAYGKRIQDTELKTVTLDLVQSCDPLIGRQERNFTRSKPKLPQGSASRHTSRTDVLPTPNWPSF
jgi:hypothetical protein